ncbi:MAG: response regulator [Candidatus Sericytochromatia bacterium]
MKTAASAEQLPGSADLPSRGRRALEQHSRVLVVDPSRIMQLLIAQQLSARNLEVVTCQDVPEALALMSSQEFSLILLEVELMAISGLDFLFWLRQHHPYIHVIVMAVEIDDALRQLLNQHQILSFRKSRQLDTLMTIIDLKLNKRGLDIAIQDIMLFELAQLAVISGKARCLQLHEPVKGHTGQVWFQQGRIVHASLGERRGEDALVDLMRLSKGTFQELPWEAPPEESIQLPFDALMMGVATLIDTQNAEEQPVLTPVSSPSRALRILVLEPEARQRAMLEQHFRQRGFEIEGVATGQAAQQNLKQQSWDLLLLDMGVTDITVRDFLEQLQSHREAPQVILTGHPLNQAVAQTALRWGVVRCYQKPLILGELEGFIRYLFSQRYFSGKLRNVGILDFLQVIALGRSSKTYRIHDLTTNQHGRLFLQEGNVTHIELGPEKGLPAFAQLLQVQRGLLTEGPVIPPPERSIELPMTRLIMQVMAQISPDHPEPSQTLAFQGSLTVDPGKVERYLQEHPALHIPLVHTRPPEFAGIRLGRTRYHEALAILLHLDPQTHEQEGSLYAPQLGVSIRCDGSQEVEELFFHPTFQGQTHDGIRLGDDVQQAIFMYGTPRFQTPELCAWEQLSCLCERGKIIGLSLGAI